ncbi:MAG: hypothetical protein ACTHK6_06665 [Solirubrobacterales bacterium]
MSWRIKATQLNADAEGSRILLSFSIGHAAGGGAFTDLPLPFPQTLNFTAGGGSDIDDHSESDLNGVAAARTVKLQLKMDDGEVLVVDPTLPPYALRQRFPWLKGMRFFAIFFPDTERPKLVTAFDSRGHMLGRSKSHGGFLFWS